MDLVITNLSATDPVTIRDLYTTIAPSGVVTITRKASELPAMGGLQAALAAGAVSLSVTPTADEIASGLLAAPQTVQAADSAPVAAAAVDAMDITMRLPFAAAAAGTADDVTIYALNALPYKMRVIWAKAIVGTAIGSATAAVRTQSAGAGTLVATMDFGTAGLVPSPNTGFATVVLTPGSSVGLFVRRSDRGVAGEILLSVRRES
jgi:hypothetical protein